ncbi:MAG TPA: DUF3887 domain-containing protein [Pyrinomonadaceae bacterium]|nr:DUF3887 domain-containing protein [Pyrinomonadaceae bacterium]
MKRLTLSLLSILIFGIAYSAVAQEAASSKETELKDSGGQFLNQLAKGDYAAAIEKFDEKTKKKMTPERMQKIWLALIDTAGSFQKLLETKFKEDKKADVVTLKCQFESGVLYMRLGFDADKKISDFDVDDH